MEESMRAKGLAVLVVLALVCPAVSLRSEGQKDMAFHEAKVKAFVQNVGREGSSQVKILLRNRNVLFGYIKDSSDQHFLITEIANPNDLEIRYSSVVKIEKYSERITAKRAMTAAAVVAGLATLLGILLYASSDGGVRSR